MLEPILANFCSTRYWAFNGSTVSRLTHEIYIPRREGACWKSHID